MESKTHLFYEVLVSSKTYYSVFILNDYDYILPTDPYRLFTFETNYRLTVL